MTPQPVPDRAPGAASRWILAFLVSFACAACASTPPSTAPATAAAPATRAPAQTAVPSHGFAPAGFRPAGLLETARVIRIVDGDTIHVLLNGTDERLRYIGMDTPEDVKPGTPVERMSLQAAAENSRLVAGKTVVLEKDVSERDLFGRLLRYVWLHAGDGWTMVGLQLVVEGYAQVATFPPDVRYADLFVAAERVARERHLGLWAPASAPPS
jgi:micrococcal nuclease